MRVAVKKDGSGRAALLVSLLCSWLLLSCAPSEAPEPAAAAEPIVPVSWVLDAAQSQVKLVSIKSSAFAETHHFTELAGDINADGIAELLINLDSIESGIAIRNERMREHLFETDRFAQASASMVVDMAWLRALPEGSETLTTVAIDLDLHGAQQGFKAELSVIKLADQSLVISTSAPVLVRAGDFAMVPGIEKLAELAGLPVIASAVPVTVHLHFKPVVDDE